MTIAKGIWKDKLNDTLKPIPQKNIIFLSTISCLEIFGLTTEQRGPMQYYNWQCKGNDDYLNVGCWELDCKTKAFHNLLSIPLSKAISSSNRCDMMLCIVLDWNRVQDWMIQLVDLFELVAQEIKSLIPENLYREMKSKRKIYFFDW
jgi:hypothetical protein